MSAVDDLGLPQIPAFIRQLLSGEFGEVAHDELYDEVSRIFDDRRRWTLRERRMLQAAIDELWVEFRGPLPVEERPIDRVRRALNEWDGPWPPTQVAIADRAGWATERSVYEACRRAGSTWHDEVAAARRNPGA